MVKPNIGAATANGSGKIDLQMTILPYKQRETLRTATPIGGMGIGGWNAFVN